MPEPIKQEIEARAYQLWEKSGQPEGREDEFRHLAQQELRNKDKSSPTRTPECCDRTFSKKARRDRARNFCRFPNNILALKHRC
jgi:hypothetical protein